MIASLKSLVSVCWVRDPVAPQVMVTEKSVLCRGSSCCPCLFVMTPGRLQCSLVCHLKSSHSLPHISVPYPLQRRQVSPLSLLLSLPQCQDHSGTSLGQGGGGGGEGGERSALWDVSSEVLGALSAVCLCLEHPCSSGDPRAPTSGSS